MQSNAEHSALLGARAKPTDSPLRPAPPCSALLRPPGLPQAGRGALQRSSKQLALGSKASSLSVLLRGACSDFAAAFRLDMRVALAASPVPRNWHLAFCRSMLLAHELEPLSHTMGRVRGSS